MSAERLPDGGLIDRAAPIPFSFEGRQLFGYAGDTLASALLANGVRVVGRSFKYHRPRGLLAAGAEEPNALMQVGTGAQSTPNLRATEVELAHGLSAAPVNCWPSARFDIGAINNLIGRFIPAGFYYKTFMWPDWHLFEPLIRKAAGLGRAPSGSDPDRYETMHAHCDVLVIGAGPAGLAAALSASQAGKEVLLAEQDFELGGTLLGDRRATIEGAPSAQWLTQTLALLKAATNVSILTRTTAIGYFDDNCVSLVQRGNPHDAKPHAPRERHWIVRAGQVILATGALERPLVFPGNDRPGVMLASAVERYLTRWGVLAGRNAAIFTNNDSAYQTAHLLLDAGARVAALVDSRASPPVAVVEGLRARNVDVLTGHVVVGTSGHHGVASVTVRGPQGGTRRIAADLLAMSGGWNPNVQMFCQSGGTLEWDESLVAFRPGVSVQAEVSVGAADGVFALEDALAQAAQVGRGAGRSSVHRFNWNIEPLWRVAASGKAFVDFQNDVTVSDIELSVREAFTSVEHLKRYTTMGMAPDQGKTSNVNGLAVLASLTGRSVPETGTTRFRFPYTPTSIGALAGQKRNQLLRPLRRTPIHAIHEAAGAVFEEYGDWARPAYYPRAGETAHDAEQREALAVRRAVGLFDASPLGKIEVRGPDAAEFLDRVYANTMSSLRIGRARYGLMLNEAGVVIDDGVTIRLADDHFVVGTTGAGAARIASWLEEWLQCEWRDLDVLTIPVTTAWGVLTVAGPKARAVLEAAGIDVPLNAEEFPHMTFREGHVAGIPARIVRASFTGELSYEINVAADRTEELWNALVEAGTPHGLCPIGIDALMVLRTEKGFLHVGADTDGSTSALDVGWSHVLKRSHDFIGRRSLTRPENIRPERLQFVGLQALDEGALPVGAHLARDGAPAGSEGYVTSAGFSPVLRRGVALGMIRSGAARMGEELVIITGEGKGRRVRIVTPCAYDPEGERLRA